MSNGILQHESGRVTSRRWSIRVFALLAMLLLLPAASLRGQSATPMPMPNTTAAPPLPLPPASAMPSAAQSQAAPTVIVQPELPGMPPVQGVEIDRLVAIVNDELILDSDVDEEKRFAALLPYGDVKEPFSRDEAIDRLINRDLILQQLQLQPGSGVSMEAARKNLDAARSSIPKCKQYHCETQAGWERLIASEGFTEKTLTKMWRERMEALAFIEERFQMGIRISPKDIQAYYEQTMLPEYAALHAVPPPVGSISKRIQQVLLQQQVSKLLDNWLQSLRAQGSVVVLHPDKEAP